jgi:hypothetical protein
MKNEALARLKPLIGTWDLTMSNAWFLDSLDQTESGHASFEWLDDAFVVFRWQLGEPPPAACVIGHSDPQSQYEMFYHDDRGVARIFVMEFTESRLSLLRQDSDFHQRFEAQISEDRIEGRWEASEDEGKTWRKDFDLLFVRAPAKSTI